MGECAFAPSGVTGEAAVLSSAHPDKQGGGVSI
jgi:hypothetical protein